jgi:hypothetical protein
MNELMPNGKVGGLSVSRNLYVNFTWQKHTKLAKIQLWLESGSGVSV